MGINFTAEEIFRMAEMIERNGAAFYRQAAKLTADVSVRQAMEGLAVLEESHERTFAAMRAQLSESDRTADTFDPEGLTGAYLKALADRRVFDIQTDPSEKLSGHETLDDLLQMAIGLEKDSIVFYLGIKEMVPASLGKDKIDAIIREEMRHISVLSQELANH